MSIKTKKKFKNVGKTVATALFALLMFTNIKFSLMSDTDIAKDGLTVFGIKINLLDDTYAKKRRIGLCGEICYIVPNSVCTYIPGYGYCDGKLG